MRCEQKGDGGHYVEPPVMPQRQDVSNKFSSQVRLAEGTMSWSLTIRESMDHYEYGEHGGKHLYCTGRLLGGKVYVSVVQVGGPQSAVSGGVMVSIQGPIGGHQCE